MKYCCKATLFAAFCALASSCPSLLFAQPLISEFMAINSDGITDEDGETSDWIELFNPTTIPIDLAGYRLTDNASVSNKWVFPSLTLAPNDFLIIFASEKNRTNALRELHTNFKLSGSGEYLALRDPGGAVVHEFAPAYPQQYSDTGYGLSGTTLISRGDAVRIFIPPDGSLGTTWTDVSFNDSTWSNGTSGVGYNVGVSSLLAHQEGNLQSYWNFDSTAGGLVPDLAPGAPHAGILTAGAALTAGGQGWGGSGEALNPNADSNTSTKGHLAADDPMSYDFNSDFTWHARVKTAGGGGGILSRAPISSNWNQGSKALFLEGSRVEWDTGWVGNPNTGVQLTDNAWHQIVVTYIAATDALKVYVDPATANPVAQYNATHNVNRFDEHSHTHNSGIADTDFRVGWVSPNFQSNEFPGLIDEVAVWTGAFPPADVALLAQDETISGSGIYSALIGSDLPQGTGSAYVRHAFSLPVGSTIDGLLFDMAFDDGFVVYLDGQQIAATNAPANPAWDSLATTDRPAADALDFTSIPLSSFPTLQGGDHVLAIHALNVSTHADEMLSLPELRGSDRTAPPGYLLQPTPGEPNNTTSPPPAGGVVFSHSGGTFTTSFTLSLTNTFGSGEIRYTTDGSIPDANSILYNDSLVLTASTQVRARVISAGFAPGPVSAGSFVKLATSSNLAGLNAPATFSSDLPVMIFDNFNGGGLNSSSYKDMRIHIFEPDEITGRTTLTNAPSATHRAAFRIRGSSSAGFAKKQYRVEIWDENDDDLDVPLLDLPAESDWIFGGPYVDEALIRNALIFELGREMGMEAPRVQFFEAFLNTNGGDLQSGDYIGVYILVEKIKVGKNRVDLANLRPSDTTEPEISGGYILRHEAGNSEEPRLNGWSHLEVADPNELNITQLDWISDYINAFGTALHGANSTDPALGYAPYIDAPSFIDAIVMNELTRTQDGYVRSAYLYKDKDAPLVNGPLWDFNLSFGISCCFNSHAIEGWQYQHSYNRGERESNPNGDWYYTLLEDPNFEIQLVDRWYTLRQTLLDTPAFNARVDALAAQIAEAQARNFLRFNTLGSRTTGFQRDEFIYPTWQEHVDHIKDWAEQRTTWMDSEFLDAPQFSSPPGPIAANSMIDITAINAVYYTTDGSDPRAPGGGFSASALLTPVGGVPVAQSTFFTARSKNGATWSPLVNAYYTVDAVPASSNNVVISELMYHPHPTNAAEAAAGFVDADQFEFIEILNISSNTVDLLGMAFTQGVELVVAAGPFSSVAPGERVLFVENEHAFAQRYGSGLPVAGRYAKRLSNGGDTLGLAAANGDVIHSFTFLETAPWPTCADGTGYSIVLLQPFSNPPPALGEHWVTSTMPYGSPGTAGTLLSYADWLAFFFTPAELALVAVSGPESDPDGDGLVTLLEYTLGTHPRKAALELPYHGSIEGPESGRYLTFTYRELLGLTGVTYLIEVSDDLINWQSGPGSSIELGSAIDLGDGTLQRVFRDVQTSHIAARRYLRLRATIAP